MVCDLYSVGGHVTSRRKDMTRLEFRGRGAHDGIMKRSWIQVCWVILCFAWLTTSLFGCRRSQLSLTCPDGTYSAGAQPPWGRHAYCLLEGTDDALKHGPEMRWFPGGKGQLSQLWSQGELNGLSTSWFSNGQRSKEGEYRQGLEHGLWKFWGRDGQLQSETPYKMGMVHGLRRFYHPGGQLKSEWAFEDGALHGECKRYSSDGELEDIQRYEKGILVGGRAQ